jgi:hypothetical protein
MNVLGYKARRLSVRYLGVPFITSKLTSSDCLILMDHIMAKARSWMNHTLLFAGHLQLIKSNPFLYSSVLVFYLHSFEGYHC